MNSFFKLLLFFVLISSSIFAKKNETKSEIQAVVLTSEVSHLSSIDLKKINGIQINQIIIPGDTQRLKERLEIFLTKEKTSDNVLAIKKEIIAYFNEHQMSATVIEAPDHEKFDGVISFIVSGLPTEEIVTTGVGKNIKNKSEVMQQEIVKAEVKNIQPKNEETSTELEYSEVTFSSNEPVIEKKEIAKVEVKKEIVKAEVKNDRTQIRGIILISNSSDIDSFSQKQQGGVLIEDLIVPGDTQKLKTHLEYFISKDLTKSNIFEIKHQIISYYEENHYPFLSIDIPEQEVTNGTIVFVINEGKIGEINFSGNKWFSNNNLKRYLHTEPGKTINKNQLLNDVAWMNRNPFHRTELLFAPGKEKRTADIELITQDRLPLRVYLGIDNTGNDFTGNQRYFIGMNWGNAFFLGDLLSYQFTTSFYNFRSDRFREFRAHTLNYTSFLPWQHTLIMWGGYSTVHPNIKDFDSNGKNAQGSMRYIIPFKPLYKQLIHELDLGFDYKYQNSSLFFTSEFLTIPLISNSVNLTQIILGYRLEYSSIKHLLTFQAQSYFSPGDWIAHQSNSDYQKLRPYAKSRYFYGLLTFGENYYLSERCILALLLRGQATTNTLLPSEQFGLGGYDTVRGFDEREIIADDAFCANLELRLPYFRFIRKIEDKLYFLGFADYGFGYNIHPLPTEKNSVHLWSAGPGLRYTIGSHLVVRADYGFQLHRTQFKTHHLGKWNFGVNASF